MREDALSIFRNIRRDKVADRRPWGFRRITGVIGLLWDRVTASHNLSRSQGLTHTHTMGMEKKLHLNVNSFKR